MLPSSGLYRSFIYLLLVLTSHLTAWVIPPRIPFSNINNMSMSVNSSSLNSSGHNGSLCVFFHAQSTLQLSLIRPVMLSPVRSKNVLDPTCSFLSTYSKRSYARLPTAIHLLQGMSHDNPPG